MLAAIDLHGCERRRLEDPGTLRRFVPSLINAIGMRAHGPLMLDRFGDGELEGWSAMQFIETSSVTVHTDEVCDRCFVDVFSCRPFDSSAAATVAAAHFGGTFTLRVLHRSPTSHPFWACWPAWWASRTPSRMSATRLVAAPGPTVVPGSSGASWRSWCAY